MARLPSAPWQPSPLSSQVPLLNLPFDLLPIFHTAEAFYARDFITYERIWASEPCDVFDDYITYFFYGRPSYKYKTSAESTNNISFYPVCFAIDLASPHFHPSAVFPFDTGAFAGSRMERYAHPAMKPEDFLLEPSASRVADAVRQFFGSNKNYLSYKKANIKISGSHFESQMISEMISGFAKDTSDERRVTIEIHGPSSVELSKGTIRGLICPHALLDDKLFKDFIENNNISHETYKVTCWQPTASFSLVCEAADRLIKRIK